ncbi:IS110 family transposase [Kutzneria sp. CA-103260]|uniref:IS110 family transposase n=1 Tax=Kutzneria sp. CA-103260 TaxID=2802641 RepID=UPI001BA4931B|nr:IS110 family transposase [Kutzneria sp. CA-103260]QUQ63350.1 IS110 family transposase ISHvo9 [Kutzneria sp. CA-103260]QUQ67095.1 IS110 family transposase ISHvo9 [Kutzneria sp. CA-103260]
MSEYDGKQFVGIDLHRFRSVIVRQTATGEQLDVVRIVNDPMRLAEEIGKAGVAPEVVVEATYGWYWAADVLAEHGAVVHLAHPLGIKGFAYRRVKNDVRDAADLADLLRMGRLPEAWVAPPAVRELRELVRHRAKLVSQRTGLKASVHAVLAKQGLRVPVTDLFGVRGRQLLAQAALDPPYRARVNSLCRLIEAFDFEIATTTRVIAARLAGDPGYATVQAIPGVGPVLAAVLVAEIGDVHRFATPRHLCSWAGLTPRHRESDVKVRRGRITKQGSTLLRWAVVEAAQRVPADAGWLVATREGIRQRRGRNIATVAVARRLLTLVFYGLRDGHIRALAQQRRVGVA